jgi:hypothetical protein
VDCEYYESVVDVFRNFKVVCEYVGSILDVLWQC